MTLQSSHLSDSVRYANLTQMAQQTHPAKIENETEVSFFNRELYEAFQANPEVPLALAFHDKLISDR